MLLRRKLRVSFLTILSCVLVGGFAAFLLRILGCVMSPSFRAFFLVASVALFAASTLAHLGWKGQTWKGDSFVEQLDEAIFWWMYMIGTVLGVLGTLAP